VFFLLLNSQAREKKRKELFFNLPVSSLKEATTLFIKFNFN
jgi:hypothetical protein